MTLILFCMCLLYLSLESNEKQAEEIGAKSTLENRKTSMGEIYTFVVFCLRAIWNSANITNLKRQWQEKQSSQKIEEEILKGRKQQKGLTRKSVCKSLLDSGWQTFACTGRPQNPKKKKQLET